MSPAELAYTEAVRAISSQAGAIDALRSRTAGLLGAASIATAFLGPASVGEHGLQGWGIVATVCFGGVGLLTLFILYPLQGWRFTLDPPGILDHYQRRPVAYEEHLLADAAHSLDRYRRENALRLEELYLQFRGASVLVAAGVIAWIFDLQGGV
jgi:hypothetical protein